MKNKKASVPGNQIHKQPHLIENPEDAHWSSGTEAFVLTVSDKGNASSEMCCQVFRNPGDPVAFVKGVEDHHLVL